MPASRHQRLLEGFLLRLARSPDAEAFALRGGMRLQQVFSKRRASDVDLVWREPGLPKLETLFRDVLSAPCPDGVRYDERFRIDHYSAPGQLSGARLVAAGSVDGRSDDFSVDVHYHIDLGPKPVRRPLQVQQGEGHVWMCEPETLIGRKVRVTALRGAQRWRPKDVADIHQLLRTQRLDRDRLAQGFDAAGASQGDVRDAIRAVFCSQSFWSDTRAQLRWRRHQRRWGAQARDLRGVALEVGSVVGDILGR